MANIMLGWRAASLVDLFEEEEKNKNNEKKEEEEEETVSYGTNVYGDGIHVNL